MKRWVQALLLALCGPALLSGCATKHPISGNEALTTLPVEPISVWVAESDLAKKIVIYRQKIEEGAHGATVARVEIANCSSEPLDIETQTLYKDLKGWTLNTSPWVRYTLVPGKKVWLMAPTIAPGTARFFIQIQPASPYRRSKLNGGS